MGIKDVLKKLDSYHFAHQKELLSRLESQRRASKRKFVTSLIFSMVAVLSLASNVDVLVVISFLLLIPLCIYSFYTYLEYENVMSKCKEFVLQDICSEIGFKFNAKVIESPIKEFRKYNIIPNHENVKFEDEVTGKLNGVKISVFEAYCDGLKKSEESFNALLTKIEFIKNIKGLTFVTTNFSLFSNFNASVGSKLQKVNLESAYFNEWLNVYSTDQVEARYILTPTFMERVLQLSNHPDALSLDLVFDQNHVYISIRKLFNSFEGGGLDVTSASYFDLLIQELKFALVSVDLLELGQRTQI